VKYVTVPYVRTLFLTAFDGQVAGYTVEYSDLTYVLVPGAGHQVSRAKLIKCIHQTFITILELLSLFSF